MPSYRTLEDKPTIKLPNYDEEILDLFAPTYFADGANWGSVNVSEPYIARPDLISLAVYYNDEYTDAICKYNGISNPFELNEGMTLFIPAYDELNEQYTNGKIKSKLVNDTDLIAKPQKTFAKNHNEFRSPNQLVEGESNYTIDTLLQMIRY